MQDHKCITRKCKGVKSCQMFFDPSGIAVKKSIRKIITGINPYICMLINIIPNKLLAKKKMWKSEK
jgi:hypothetical protein